MAVPMLQPELPVVPSNLRHDLDLTSYQLQALLSLTQQVKQARQRYATALKGRYIALLFEKPSLRTRMTFELAVKQLGGDCVTQTGLIGDREPLKDVARNLARWTDLLVARTFAQDTVDQLAHWSGLPVINALTDLYHPCQAFADMVTLKERLGKLAGRKLAYVGDGNNVAHSLMLAATRLGMHFSIATPRGYEAKADIVALAEAFGAENGVSVKQTSDPTEAVRNADAIYTDVWVSMGQEAESCERKQVFAPYQVNASLMAKADKDALFMHCLPAKRGLEVTDEVIESANSVVFEQAENRLHVQKALLLTLLQ